MTEFGCPEVTLCRLLMAEFGCPELTLCMLLMTEFGCPEVTLCGLLMTGSPEVILCGLFMTEFGSSVQFKMVSMHLEKPICAPLHLSEVSPTLPLKWFQ